MVRSSTRGEYLIISRIKHKTRFQVVNSLSIYYTSRRSPKISSNPRSAINDGAHQRGRFLQSITSALRNVGCRESTWLQGTFLRVLQTRHASDNCNFLWIKHLPAVFHRRRLGALDWKGSALGQYDSNFHWLLDWFVYRHASTTELVSNEVRGSS